MLMSTVVVDNEVNGQRLGCFPFDLLEETQPLHMGVPLFSPGDQLAVQVVESRKQGDGAVSLVVMIRVRMWPIPKGNPG